MPRRLLLPGLFALVLAAGCATAPDVKLYDGPDRAGRELATVVVPYQVEISDINGTGIPWRSGIRSMDKQAYKLLPGRYTFRFRFTSPYEFGQERQGIATPVMGLIAEIEAGKSYAFKTRVKGQDATTAEVSVWLENAGGKRIDEPIVAELPRPGPTRPMSPQPVTPEPFLPKEEPASENAPAPEQPPAPEAETSAAASSTEQPSDPAASAAPAPAAPAALESPDAVDALKAAWEKANPDQRAEFLKWITRP